MALTVFGVRFHECESWADLRRTCERFLDGDRAHLIFTPNPEILLYAREHPDYRDLLNGADLALPDGTGIAVVEFLRARHRIRRWPGIDVGEMLLRLTAERAERVLLIGGSGGAAEQAAAVWRARLPGLLIETAGDGVALRTDGTAGSPREETGIADRIRRFGPAIVLAGLGAPKQERWIARHAGDFPSVRIMMGIGGAFDMWAGRFPRAPGFLRPIGLEWLWRMIRQPRRFPRILRAVVLFPWRALRDRSHR